MSQTQHDLTKAQFGPQASAYVASAVHSAGADLEWLAGIAAALGAQQALDIGSGGGHVTYALAPHVAEVVACDLSPEMVAAVEAEAARRGLRNVRVQIAAAERLPFEDGRFDLVASRFSAHHWPDLGRGLREARRVLRPGGKAVFIDAVSPQAPMLDTHLQAVELLRDPSHARDYRTSEWTAALEEAGFRIEEAGSWRLRLDFASWTARMNTPPENAAAIRSLQGRASEFMAAYFGIEADGSFMLDVARFRLTAC